MPGYGQVKEESESSVRQEIEAACDRDRGRQEWREVFLGERLQMRKDWAHSLSEMLSVTLKS